MSKGSPRCLPSPPGSYPSPGCWCRGQASPSSRWDRRRLPDRPAARHDSCSTDAAHTQLSFNPPPSTPLNVFFERTRSGFGSCVSLATGTVSETYPTSHTHTHKALPILLFCAS